jgi:diaminopropionate ammonia-lyase
MKDAIKWVKNTMPPDDCAASMALLSAAETKKARDFHKSFPQYEQTPLVRLVNLAGRLGLKGLYLKDESFRFKLNAFKVLGASYAIARFIAKKTGKDISALNYGALVSDELKNELGDITFYTATDGNHGRGVAWAANKLRQKSVVLMPKGSSPTRLENIRKEGADATITGLNYDDAVRLANGKASRDPDGVMVQDTAWDGYEEIPSWIMQGYGTMALEADGQLHSDGVTRPTHIFVQAGVGSLAGAVQGFFANVYHDNPPVVTVVEARAADCHYRSAKENRLVAVGGDLDTIMAGLACGEANTISWKILKNHAGYFVSAPDWVSAKGMRMLGAPLRGDARVISGESGAVTAGLVAALMENDDCRSLREALGLNKDSVVLLFSTEGDTDPLRYQSIVWDGGFASISN